MIKKIAIFMIIVLIVLFSYIKLKNFKVIKVERNYEKGMHEISINELKNKISNKESFLLYTYNNYCTFSKPCENIFENVLEKNDYFSYKIKYELLLKTIFKNKVKYAPSFIIVRKGKIIDYLDANSKDDYDKYQKEEVFEKWLKKHVKKG